MTTEKQFAANRANAQMSSGPRTEAGKAASSQNAVKHNLTSKHLIVLPGQEEAFAELESGLREKLNPQGTLEDVLYKRIVECSWNLERCRNAQVQVLTQIGNFGIDPLASILGYDERLDRIHRYTRENENSLYKAMRELGKLQSESQYRAEICPLTQDQAGDPAFVAQTPHALSQVCSLSQIRKHVMAFHKNPKPIANHDSLEALPNPGPIEFESRFEPISQSNPTPSTNLLVAA